MLSTIHNVDPSVNVLKTSLNQICLLILSICWNNLYRIYLSLNTIIKFYVRNYQLTHVWEHCFLDQYIIMCLCYQTAMNMSLQPLLEGWFSNLSLLLYGLPLFILHIYWESPSRLAQKNACSDVESSSSSSVDSSFLLSLTSPFLWIDIAL